MASLLAATLLTGIAVGDGGTILRTTNGGGPSPEPNAGLLRQREGRHRGRARPPAPRPNQAR